MDKNVVSKHEVGEDEVDKNEVEENKVDKDRLEGIKGEDQRSLQWHLVLNRSLPI